MRTFIEALMLAYEGPEQARSPGPPVGRGTDRVTRCEGLVDGKDPITDHGDTQLARHDDPRWFPAARPLLLEEWALGMSRLFLKAGQLKALEDMRSEGGSAVRCFGSSNGSASQSLEEFGIHES